MPVSMDTTRCCLAQLEEDFLDQHSSPPWGFPLPWVAVCEQQGCSVLAIVIIRETKLSTLVGMEDPEEERRQES